MTMVSIMFEHMRVSKIYIQDTKKLETNKDTDFFLPYVMIFF